VIKFRLWDNNSDIWINPSEVVRITQRDFYRPNSGATISMKDGVRHKIIEGSEEAALKINAALP
jgi:hypothetical protein